MGRGINCLSYTFWFWNHENKCVNFLKHFFFLNNRRGFGPAVVLIWAAFSLPVHWGNCFIHGPSPEVGSCTYCVSLAFVGFSRRPWPVLGWSVVPSIGDLGLGQLRLLEKGWGGTGAGGPLQRCRALFLSSFLGGLSSEHPALTWLSWFFPHSKGLQWRESVLEHSDKVLQFHGRKKKWQIVFPGYF